MSGSADSTPSISLEQISTRWTAIHDPVQFTLRYAVAIQQYITALVRHPQDAEDVTQEFLTRTIHHGFPNVSPDRGRFRDYLKRAVRNAAVSHLRKSRPQSLDLGAEPAVEDLGDVAADAAWIAHWRSCLLDKVWREIDRVQLMNPGNYFCTVLRIWLDHESENSAQLAARVSAAIGRSLKPEAFRKQLSRARQEFGELLLSEVRQTLDHPTREELEEELIELELLPVLQKFLPESA